VSGDLFLLFEQTMDKGLQRFVHPCMEEAMEVEGAEARNASCSRSSGTSRWV
jgi:hypothetical protein